MNAIYISTRQYAQKHRLSKMQVTRLIRAGKIAAQKVGRNWMISTDPTNANQINLEKYTSIQKWAKLIEVKLHKTIHVEQSKDRELIYSRLYRLGLPHERSYVFPLGKFPTKTELEVAIGRLGTPYWISAIPDPKLAHLNRQSKLHIYDLNSGWNFIGNLQEKEHYKIFVAQYADDPGFKGTALIAPSGKGMAEFITGDRHYIMTRGFTLTDPMLFDQTGIRHYSSTISKRYQDNLYHLVRGVYGHLEFQHGVIAKHRSLTFFDYNDEEAYIEVEHIWDDLEGYYSRKKKTAKRYLYGLPTSSGQASGRALVVHHEEVGLLNGIQKGDILISDTTTPEMTSLLAKAAAVVTDLGGVTCHAAIVCRELHIPAIVGVGNATEKLRTGDKVKVDADKGEIEILEN